MLYLLTKRFSTYFDESNLELTFPLKDRILLTYEVMTRTKYSEKISSPSFYAGKENHEGFGIQR